ncbi:hypothetical protein GCM10008955_36770 [Deinococcus malanensis]|uniref:Ester cyclase n=1 Tax=Deinococcus malanensis TaxID=1706855 RepID=A0ABQ2F0V2_9DEIO|nr:ester cyclase [Deinococcus malanensis]GGK39587.1 hypothetical protein GCM10008955_36770 [Deinococcus malanensis]
MQTQVTQPDTRLIDTFSQANWDAFRDLLTPDVIYEEPSTQRRTQDADTYVQLCQGWLRALPDGRGVVLRSVHSGDTLVHEVRWEGTHNGPLDTPGGSIPPTGRWVSFEGVMWCEMKGDRIGFIRHHLDVLSLLQQIGALPAP